MENRVEEVVELISDLKDAFPETQDSVFVALLKRLIARKLSDREIKSMVDKTIDTVAKARLTVADVIINSNEKPKREVYVVQ
jgi:hypothetical protein